MFVSGDRDPFAQLGLPPSGIPARHGRGAATTDVVERALSGEDLFVRLGLPCEAIPVATVRQKYREAALLLQSDRCASHPQAKLALERVQEAFETLKDPSSQSRYLAQLEVEGRTRQIYRRSSPGTEPQRLPAWDEGWHQYEQRSQQCSGGSSSTTAPWAETADANERSDRRATEIVQVEYKSVSASVRTHASPKHIGSEVRSSYTKPSGRQSNAQKPRDDDPQPPSRPVPFRFGAPAPGTSGVPPWKHSATVAATFDADATGDEDAKCIAPLGDGCDEPSGDAMCCSTPVSPVKASGTVRSPDSTLGMFGCGLTLSGRWTSAFQRRFNCVDECVSEPSRGNHH